MILALAEGAPPGSLFIVGDPKQSIYRFRRADIETYEAAKATVGKRGAEVSLPVGRRGLATAVGLGADEQQAGAGLR